MTLKEIKQQFNQIAQNHKEINSFGWGDIWEIATSGTVEYPLMWVQLEPASIADRVQTMNFKVILMDIVANGELNEDDVLNDMLEVAKGVIGQLEHPSYDWDLETGNIEPFTERFNDSVSGWVFDVALRVPFTFDRCAEPYTGNISTDVLCPSVTIYDSNGNVLTTVSAGGSYTVTTGGNATVENSDLSYTNTVASGATLVTPDISVNIDNSVGNYYSNFFPSVKDVTVTLADTQYDIYVNGAFNQTVSLPALQDDTININAV